MAETKMIRLADLAVSMHNVRTAGIDKGIENLMASIRRLGLIEPITVTIDESGRYVILVGQRRFHAYNMLDKEFPGQGFDEIECLVKEGRDDDTGKAMSLAEGITHIPPPRDDLIEAVTDLFIKSGGIYRAVEETYGLTRYMVDKYVGLSRMPPKLKDAVMDGSIHPRQKTAENLALRAMTAFEYVPGGGIGEEKLIEFARAAARMKKSTSILVSEAKRHPDKTVDQMVRDARRSSKVDLVLHMNLEQDSMLGIYADRHSYDTKEDAALDIIVDRLGEEDDSW